MLAAEILEAPVTKSWLSLRCGSTWSNQKILNTKVERVSLEVRQGRWSLDLGTLFASLTSDTRALPLNSPSQPPADTSNYPAYVNHGFEICLLPQAPSRAIASQALARVPDSCG